MAGKGVSAGSWKGGRRSTADLYLVPELKLGLARRRLFSRGSFGSSIAARDGGEGLGGVGSERLGIILLDRWQICRSTKISGFSCGGRDTCAARNPRGLLLLELLGEGFNGEGLDDVFGSGGEERKNGVGTVFLVLLEAAIDAGKGSIPVQLQGVGRLNYFSFATRSLIIRLRASDSLLPTYWTAK
jgi:hypothetical protein